MDAQQELDFDRDTEKFVERPEWLAYTSTPALELLIDQTRQRVETNGGYSSISAFEITFNELVQSGQLVKLRNVDLNDDEPKPFILTPEEYRSTPSRTIQLRYKQNPAYRAAVDKLFAEGRV